jgi:hypothetical protein
MKKVALLLLLLLFLCACEGGSETFTVTLDFDYLGMIEEQQVENGDLVSKPLQNPTLPDRNNLGWFVQGDDGEWREWNFESDTVSSDMTLKLMREEQVVERYTYALIYDDDAERVEIGQAVKGADPVLPEPTWEGHTFLGWECDANERYTTDANEEIRVVFHAKWSDVPEIYRVVMGQYEQDNDTENGKEAIEWLVIDRNEDGSAYLLVSDMILEWMMPSSTAPWQNGTLRTFLRDTFYEGAFSDEERNAIRLTALGDVETSDYVFLLNQEELQLLATAEYYAGKLTEYTTEQQEQNPSDRKANLGAYSSYPYWLRAADSYQGLIITYSGRTNIQKPSALVYAGLRPAMWVDAAYVDALLAQQ